MSEENVKQTDAKPKNATEVIPSEVEALKFGPGPKKPIPPELNKAYLIDGDSEKGGKYYFKEKPDVEAFRDKGTKLITKSTASSVAQSMVSLAESKQWESLKVTGSDKFKREVWLEAKTRGLEVSGYKPTEQDLQNLNARLNSVEQGAAKSEKIDNKPKEVDKTQNLSVAAAGKAAAASGDNRQDHERSHKDELRDTYNRLSKEDAIKKHPELEPLYSLEKAASHFVNHEMHKGRFDEAGKTQFVNSVKEKGLETLAQGKALKAVSEKVINSPDKSRAMEEIAR